jgi:hypothetical protein
MGNAIVDRSADELIGAVVIALALSLVMAGVYSVGRRKLSENLMPMIVLMIVANLVSMALGAGYMLHARRAVRHVSQNAAPALPPRAIYAGKRDIVLVQTFFRAADTNRDGLLTGEEASRAASELVRQVDTSGKGSIDAQSLDNILQAAVFLEDEGRAQHFSPRDGRPPAPPRFGSMRRILLEPAGPRPEPSSAKTAESTDATSVSTEPVPKEAGVLR